MVPKSPAEVLFSTYHRRILGLLLLRPEQSFYVREIARLVDVPPGSLHRELKRLAESGLLLREPLGNQIRYRANTACPIYPELAELFRKTAGLADLLREALAPLAKRITAAFVFGSMARGGGTAASDVDLFVIGEVDFACSKSTAVLSQEIVDDLQAALEQFRETAADLGEVHQYTHSIPP